MAFSVGEDYNKSLEGSLGVHRNVCSLSETLGVPGACRPLGSLIAKCPGGLSAMAESQ